MVRRTWWREVLEVAWRMTSSWSTASLASHEHQDSDLIMITNLMLIVFRNQPEYLLSVILVHCTARMLWLTAAPLFQQDSHRRAEEKHSDTCSDPRWYQLSVSGDWPHCVCRVSLCQLGTNWWRCPDQWWRVWAWWWSQTTSWWRSSGCHGTCDQGMEREAPDWHSVDTDTSEICTAAPHHICKTK